MSGSSCERLRARPLRFHGTRTSESARRPAGRTSAPLQTSSSPGSPWCAHPRQQLRGQQRLRARRHHAHVRLRAGRRLLACGDQRRTTRSRRQRSTISEAAESHLFHGVSIATVREAGDRSLATRRRNRCGFALVAILQPASASATRTSPQRNRMARPGQVIAQAFVRAAERELDPTECRAARTPPLSRHSSSTHSVAADRGRGVDDDDRRAARIGIDVDEPVEPDVEAALLARLADGGSGRAVRRGRRSRRETPTCRSPGSIARRTSTRRSVGGCDDRADGDLRIDVEHEAAARADQPLRLGRLSAAGARARRRSAGRTDTRASRRAGADRLQFW